MSSVVDKPKRKRDSNKKKALHSKKKYKSRRYACDILDELTPQRRREINHIIRRSIKCDMITPAFITSALRSAKLVSDKIKKIPEYKETLEKQKAYILNKVKDDAEKKKKIERQFDRKVAKLDRIQASFEKTNRVCLKAGDEVLLSKIKLPKRLSGYMLYAKETRDSIQEGNPGAGFGEIGRLIGKSWKEQTDAERDIYKERASAS